MPEPGRHTHGKLWAHLEIPWLELLEGQRAQRGSRIRLQVIGCVQQPVKPAHSKGRFSPRLLCMHNLQRESCVP